MNNSQNTLPAKLDEIVNVLGYLINTLPPATDAGSHSDDDVQVDKKHFTRADIAGLRLILGDLKQTTEGCVGQYHQESKANAA
jgi:hypothetical protein